MIALTKLDGTEIWINPHQIETVEQRPNTMIFLLSGKVIIVRQEVAEVRARIIEYRRAVGVLKNED